MQKRICVDYSVLYEIILAEMKTRHEDVNTAEHIADAYVRGFENTLNLPGIAEYIQKLLNKSL